MVLRIRTARLSWLLVLGCIVLGGLAPTTAGASPAPRQSAPAAGSAHGAGHPTAARPAAQGRLTAPAPLSRGAIGRAAVRRLRGGHVPLAFEPNRGQTDRRVAYLAHGAGYTLFLTAQGAVLSLTPSSAPARPAAQAGRRPHAATTRPAAQGAVLRLTLAGANPHAHLVATGRLPGYVNYLLGRDPRHWHTHVPTYAGVAYQDVYPGIDLAFYSRGGQLEYDWRLHAGADPRRIRLTLQGQQWVRGRRVPVRSHLDRRGNLVLPTALGTLVQRVPTVAQTVAGRRHAISARYAPLAHAGVGLRLGAYDPRRPLVVDPVLLYATYLGGSRGEAGYAVALDSSGDIYVAGNTGSTNFPLHNAYQSTLKGVNECNPVACIDAVLSKFSPSGTTLLYSTYLGGTGSETAAGVAVDRSGNIYLGGLTDSSNFPVTSGAYQATYGGTHSCNPVGNNDAYLAKLNAAGSALLYASYFGGCLADQANALALDSSGHAYLVGSTGSTDLPTKNAYQATSTGGQHAFVAAFDTTQSGAASLVYGTYLRGTTNSGSDAANGIAVDGSGAAYVTGNTSSTTFPTTSGAFQTTFAGSGDVFVSEFAPGGASLLYSTYVGGSGSANGTALALDPTGGLAVVGTTTAGAWITTTGCLQPAYGGGFEDALAFHLAPSLPASRQLVWSTYLGGGDFDTAAGVAVDAAGETYVAGGTASLNFPVQNALQPQRRGPSDGYVAAFGPGGALAWSTYLGGSGLDGANALLADGAGHVDVIGGTASSDFPVTPNAYQASYASPGYYDVFLAQLSATGFTPGTIPWHPHSSNGGLGALGAGLSLSVDLFDGHADVAMQDMQIPGRGWDLTVQRTWDSALAQTAGITPSAAGLVSSLTPRMGGVLTGTVVYSAADGAQWPFVYTGSPTDSGPYSRYRTPPGQPWSLLTASAGYTLTDILTSETWSFDSQGRLTRDQDAYGNTTTLAQGANGPTSEANSGGRSLALGYSSGRLSDAQSPLWQSSGGTQGQHVSYGYNGGGQLTSRTLGAGTPDALSSTFGYSGTQLTTITTPLQQSWRLGYDGAGRVSSVSSPVSGTVGQRGYTPADTTTYSYNPGQTVVVVGDGSSAPLTTTYSFDAQGEPITTTDALGHSRTASYDVDHDVTSSTDANAHTTTNAYQYVGPNASTGLVTQTVQPAIAAYVPGNQTLSPVTTLHSYNASNDLTETVSPEGGMSLYGYDGHHGVVTTTVQTNALPCSPAPCAGQANQWQGTLTSYDPYGELTAVTDGRGVNITSSGVASLAPTAGQYTQHQTYTTAGDLQAQGTAPITTTLTGVTHASTPVTTTYGYDGDGNQTSLTTANGNTSTSSYDHLGRQTQVTQPQVTLYSGAAVKPTQTTRYDGDDRVTQQVDGNGDVTQESYDAQGRLVAETNPVSGTTVYTYTATEQTAMQDPLGNVGTSQYDAAGRLTQQTNPVNGTVQDGYDAVGNTTAITSGDTSGNITQTEAISYNALDEPLTDTISGPGQPPTTTLTAYDTDGNVVQVQHPNGDVTYTSYDAAGQLRNTEIDAGLLSPTQATTHPAYDSYSYDQAGNQILHVDADGRASSTQYDGANRAVQSVDASGPPTGTTTITTTPSYDPNGNTLSQSTRTTDSTTPGIVQTHTYTDSYNLADWAISSADDGKATSYGYDGAGRLTTQTQFDPTGITTVLDAEGRATAIGESTNGTGPYTSTFGYNANDLPLTATLPGGVQQSAQYDPGSRLTQLTTTGASGLSPSAYSYGYNALGWTTSATGISGTDTLTHNALGRLTAESGPSVLASIPGRAYHWSYDGNGNILTGTDDFGTVYTNTYSTSQPNELVQSYDPDAHSNPTNTTYFAYDRHGDTTAITTSGAVTSSEAISTGITYDAQEQPITITHKDAAYSSKAGAVFDTISAQYNGLGLRSRYTVVVSGTAILDQRFSYRDDGTIGQVAAMTATLNGNGTIKSSGAYTDTFVYTQDGEPLQFVRTSNGQTNRYWYVLDGRNNVVAVTDSTGKVVDSYAYDSWGEMLTDLTKQQVPQQLRYGGYWQDDAVGWYWATTRYYDPEIMRWVQPDLSELDGVHTYVYVGDDPVDLTDLLGLLTCSGSHDVLSWLGNAACDTGNFVGNVGQGVWSGAVDTAQGIGSIGHAAWNSTAAWVYDPQTARAQVLTNLSVADYVTHHPLAAGQAVVIAAVAPCGNAVRSGNAGRAVGRCGFDLLMLVGGTKGLTKFADLGKLGKLGEVANLSSREDWAVLSGMLRAAARGKGNFGIGQASRGATDILGRAWVGPNYTVASDGKTLISADRLRQYRPPSFKPNLGRTQANLEWRVNPSGQWQGNAHIDIVP